jgi:hypothetical protein
MVSIFRRYYISKLKPIKPKRRPRRIKFSTGVVSVESSKYTDIWYTDKDYMKFASESYTNQQIKKYVSEKPFILQFMKYNAQNIDPQLTQNLMINKHFVLLELKLLMD